MTYILKCVFAVSLLFASVSVLADETLVTCWSGEVLVRIQTDADSLFLSESLVKRGVESVQYGPAPVTQHDWALEREVFRSDQFKLVTQVVGDEMAGEEEHLEASYLNKVTGKRLRHMKCD